MSRLGKLPFVPPPSGTVMRFDFVLRSLEAVQALPPVPSQYSWKNTIPDSQWDPLGNQGNGDCTVAAAAHMMMCWTDNAIPPRWTFITQDVLEDYNNYRTSADGAALQNILEDWRTLGLHRRDNGAKVTAKIDDYALLDITHRPNLKTQVPQAVYLFGGCYIGVELPKYAMNPSQPGHPPTANSAADWDLTAEQLTAKGSQADPDPKGGHCVCVVGYDPTGLQVVTWGALARMSWDFFMRYSDEAWVVLCQGAWLAKDGSTPSGLTASQLRQNFAWLRKAGHGAFV